MSNSKRYKSLGLVILFIFINSSVYSQTHGKYSLIAFAGGGVSLFAGEAGYPPELNAQLSKIKAIGTLRLMLQPDHLLGIGIETGLTNFYSYEARDTINRSVEVKAVPLLIVFSMPLAKHLQIFFGPGNYFVASKLKYDQVVKTTTLSLGWMVAGSYNYPLSGNCDIATEFKWLSSRETRDGSLSLQILLKWKFYKR